jgi:hypothetical protein
MDRRCEIAIVVGLTNPEAERSRQPRASRAEDG